MRGTVLLVNKAMLRPILVAGVEKRLAMVNALISFPLVAATHFKFPACFIGVAFYVGFHFILRMISNNDPYLASLFKRSTRYSLRAYFPAHSHPLLQPGWKIKTVSRPW